jgi:hypothetical protein
MIQRREDSLIFSSASSSSKHEATEVASLVFLGAGCCSAPCVVTSVYFLQQARLDPSRFHQLVLQSS